MTFRELREQARSVTDGMKIAAYRTALGGIVKPGDVVISLGCGSGLLGLLALEAGAAKLIAVEEGAVIELARETFRVNGCLDRVVMHRAEANQLELAVPADVLVLDPDGPFVPETGLSSAVTDLQTRGVLRSGAAMIPALFELFVAPVSIPRDKDPVLLWSKNTSGLDFSPFARSAMNTPIPVSAAPSWLLGPEQLAGSRSVTDASLVTLEQHLPIEVDGVLTGILGFSETRLTATAATLVQAHPISLSGMSARQIYHPVGSGLLVSAGDDVVVSFLMSSGRRLVTWRVRSSGQEVMGSTFLGTFVDPLSPR